MLNFKKLLICFTIIYGIIITMFLYLTGRNTEPDIYDRNADITRLRAEVELLRMRLQMSAAKTVEDRITHDRSRPSTKLNADLIYNYDKQRRKVKNGLKEMRYFIESQLTSIIDKLKSKDFNGVQLSQSISSLLEDVSDHFRSTQLFLNNMTKNDGYNEFRHKTIAEVADIIQNRLHALQFPSDCSNIKIVKCAINKACGFACQLHHVAYCLLFAYATGRHMILDSSTWSYSSSGFDSVFKPLGNCSGSRLSVVPWNGDLKPRVIALPIIDSIAPRPEFLPMAIPSNVAKELIGLHGNPFAFFIGQLLTFIFKLQPNLQHTIEERKKELRIERPLVGFHIRRTDKIGLEAASHQIDEYMRYGEEFFAQYNKENPDENISRNVFIATDDPKVLDEATRRFSGYKFAYNRMNADKASVKRRYSHESLIGIIMDVVMLSECDFIVCTFSSQVCRLAYELMQARYSNDASWRAQSLDDVFYYGGQNSHDQRAVFKHVGKNGEISFEKGDIIGIAGNHWNGYSKGTNKRTKKIGLYPSYKAEEIIPVFDLIQ